MSYGLSNVSYAVGPGLRFADEYGFPRFDQLPQNERLAPDAPLLAGTIRGQPIVLAERDPRYGQTGGRTITQPITVSRLRRAIDIERGIDTGPFVASAIDDFPLSGIGPVAGTAMLATFVGIVALGAFAGTRVAKRHPGLGAAGGAALAIFPAGLVSFVVGAKAGGGT